MVAATAIYDIHQDQLKTLNAVMKRPKEIAYFSYDDKHQFRLDASSIRYYYPPPLGADLSKGFDTFQKLDDTADDHLDSLLKTILAHEQETGSKVSANIITWRGMMTKIMAAPFSRDSFEMNATLFQGTIFIEENHSYKLASWEKQRQWKSPPGRPSQDLMSFWGYKFETLCLLPDTWDKVSREFIENRENEIVNNYAQYCSVVQTGIGNSSIVVGGEVDAVWDIKPEDKNQPINWVELKTSAELSGNDRDLLGFERKLMKFWAQSFLLGVPKIIVGFRSRNGILQRLEEINTASIPGTVKRTGKGTWDGNICINFAASFLDFLKDTITGEGVWRIRKLDNSNRLEVFRMEESGTGDIISNEFRDWRTKLAAAQDK